MKNNKPTGRMRPNQSLQAAGDVLPRELTPHYRSLVEHLGYVTETRTGAREVNGWIARDLVLLGWRRSEKPYGEEAIKEQYDADQDDKIIRG